MTVYVDDMKATFGRMKMCHLIADTTAELLAMVDRIGVQRKWIQHPDTPEEHFDIALGKRDAAIAAGAVPITWRQYGGMVHRRKLTGSLGTPDDAEQFLRDVLQARRQPRTAFV
ncbi:DUF4031 domain-containing protein [Azospirillum brasilense]|uniref:DUF4031 domain-containing protein n=1 Tax=Azospirillum argentinense TaxID=2970906 RepID=UPI00190E50D9|nr:DUF4031 domain-containing protein [Azospirillum argentinense]MBK3798668.1 DUF4031 domain-containing protein [Azospirillum argentinense]